MSHDPNDPNDPNDPRNQNPTWQAMVDNATKTLNENPVGMARADKDLLRTLWGKPEFDRRYQHALEHSGQLNMKVSVHAGAYKPGAQNTSIQFEGRMKPRGDK